MRISFQIAPYFVISNIKKFDLISALPFLFSPEKGKNCSRNAWFCLFHFKNVNMSQDLHAKQGDLSSLSILTELCYNLFRLNDKYLELLLMV